MPSEFIRWIPAAVAVLYVAWMTAGVARRRRTVEWHSVRKPWTTYALFSLLYANLLASALEAWVRGGAPPSPAAWGGAVLIGAKAVLTAWCIRSLGPAYSYHLGGASGGGLVTSGPYALCRHPMYAARLLATAGIPLAFGAWFVLAPALAADWIMLALRMRSEEQGLLAAYGEGYARYRERVGALLPVPRAFLANALSDEEPRGGRNAPQARPGREAGRNADEPPLEPGARRRTAR